MGSTCATAVRGGALQGRMPDVFQEDARLVLFFMHQTRADASTRSRDGSTLLNFSRIESSTTTDMRR